jgi:hypothetical protein
MSVKMIPPKGLHVFFGAWMYVSQMIGHVKQHMKDHHCTLGYFLDTLGELVWESWNILEIEGRIHSIPYQKKKSFIMCK